MPAKAHFTNLHEHDPKVILDLVDKAIAFKKSPPTGMPLAGKSVVLCFLNPSLRTRASMEIAAASLGATPVVLAPGKDAWAMEHAMGVVMDGGRIGTQQSADYHITACFNLTIYLNSDLIS